MISRDFSIHLPKWIDDLKEHSDDYCLILTNDCDSMYSCRLLNKLFGVEIAGFFSFTEGLYINKDLMKNKKPIYVDASVIADNALAFDNHRNLLAKTNHMMVNPNTITDCMNDKSYYGKYPGSTLLLISAMYSDLDSLTELEKEFLCAIDKFYLGYYRNNGAFKHINLKWLELLGMREVLEPILEKHDEKYFDDLIDKWHLKEQIYIKNGYLKTWIDCLPKEKFTLLTPVETKLMSKEEIEKTMISDAHIFSAAETYKGCYVVSVVK